MTLQQLGGLRNAAQMLIQHIALSLTALILFSYLCKYEQKYLCSACDFIFIPVQEEKVASITKLLDIDFSFLLAVGGCVYNLDYVCCTDYYRWMLSGCIIILLTLYNSSFKLNVCIYLFFCSLTLIFAITMRFLLYFYFYCQLVLRCFSFCYAFPFTMIVLRT